MCSLYVKWWSQWGAYWEGIHARNIVTSSEIFLRICKSATAAIEDLQILVLMLTAPECCIIVAKLVCQPCVYVKLKLWKWVGISTILRNLWLHNEPAKYTISVVSTLMICGNVDEMLLWNISELVTIFGASQSWRFVLYSQADGPSNHNSFYWMRGLVDWKWRLWRVFYFC